MHLRLKEYYQSFSKRKPSVCILKITRVQQGTAFSSVLFKNDHRLTYFILPKRKKRSALFCCCGRIEIKYRYLFSWLLQNNFVGVKMLFEIQKPQLFFFINISPPRRLFCNKHKKTRALFLMNKTLCLI